MPEEEGEDEADTEAHEPGDEQERSCFDILELSQHGNPLGHLPRGLREHLGMFEGRRGGAGRHARVQPR